MKFMMFMVFMVISVITYYHIHGDDHYFMTVLTVSYLLNIYLLKFAA